ncbi:MAG: hybrid sensor histidine kinase/response regulator [Coxiellaceae bacterium]|nr:hybrid sensor histidine kinase/response regulator [Coxiellaceae bacterium]
MKTGSTIDLLIICQSDERIALLQKLLQQLEQLNVESQVVDQIDRAEELLKAGEFSLILLDSHLPNDRDNHGLMVLISDFPEVPVIEFGDDYNAEIEEVLLDVGAQDYLPLSKITPVGLKRTFRRSLERHRIMKESEVLKENVHLLSEVKMVNQELNHRNQEIMQFYQTISHELKTPLTSVVSFVSILQDEISGPINIKQQEYLHIIQKNCTQITTCVNDLLTIASMETAKFILHTKPLDLTQLIDRVVKSIQPIAEKKKLQLTAKLGSIPDVAGDDVRITEVLNNLLSNAMKFTSERGSITVKTKRSKKDKRFVEVSVVDTGAGISEKHALRIFDRLYQVEGSDVHAERGLGLGLHICQQIVKLHGGDISVESQLGRGTTFTFTFPIAGENDG